MNYLKIFILSMLSIINFYLINISIAAYSQELQDAYNFAYQNKITTINSIDKADMEGGLTRIAMAKMLSQYAINILGKSPDTSKFPNFGDIDSKLNEDYNNGVTLAYQLGIMGIGIDKFRPFDLVTRAEFGTALSRVLYGTKNEGGNPYYINHLKALQNSGIMTQINQPNQLEIRGYVMLMLMRANHENRINNSDNENQINNSDNQINNNSGDYSQYTGGILHMAIYGGVAENKPTHAFPFTALNFKLIIFGGYKDKGGNYPKVYSIEFKKIGNLDISFIDSIRMENGYGVIITDKLSGISSDTFKLNIKDKYQTIPSSAKEENRKDRRWKLYVNLKHNNLPDTFTLGFVTNYINHSCDMNYSYGGESTSIVIFDGDNDLFIYESKSLNGNISTDDNLSNNDSSNSDSQLDETQISDDENPSNDNTSNNDNLGNDNNSNNDDYPDSSNDFPSNSANCTNIKVDNGNSYDFCIEKLDGTNFRMSVNNTENLSMCTIGKGGQTWDFSNCLGEFTVLGAQGQSNLWLTIKYNNKSYNKTASYDFDNGVFVNN